MVGIVLCWPAPAGVGSVWATISQPLRLGVDETHPRSACLRRRGWRSKLFAPTRKPQIHRLCRVIPWQVSYCRTTWINALTTFLFSFLSHTHRHILSEAKKKVGKEWMQEGGGLPAHLAACELASKICMCPRLANRRGPHGPLPSGWWGKSVPCAQHQWGGHMRVSASHPSNHILVIRWNVEGHGHAPLDVHVPAKEFSNVGHGRFWRGGEVYGWAWNLRRWE